MKQMPSDRDNTPFVAIWVPWLLDAGEEVCRYQDYIDSGVNYPGTILPIEIVSIGILKASRVWNMYVEDFRQNNG